jgi:myo-inositol-1(or 4)-monophosphatase
MMARDASATWLDSLRGDGGAAVTAAAEGLAGTLAIAEGIAREAGRILLEGWGNRPRVRFKTEDNDLVTEFDKRSEALVVARLSEAFPDHGIVGEEGTAVRGGAERVWYVDPLDGTVNFAHGMPLFAVSLGLAERGVPVCGVVHAPALGWTFTGAVGVPAGRDGVAISPSPTDRLERSLLVTGFPTSMKTRMLNVPAFVAMNGIAEGMRRLGSAALDLCFVACGWLEGTWQREIQPWDTVGGVAIVNAAGGKVSDVDGGPFDPLAGRVIASNGLIHDQLVQALARVAAAGPD